MLKERKILICPYAYEGEKNQKQKNPAELFLNDGLLRLSYAICPDRKVDVEKMSDYERFAFVCGLVDRGRGTYLFDSFVREIFCVFAFRGEKEYAREFFSKEEIDCSCVSELWRKLCVGLGFDDVYSCDEKSNNKKNKKIYIPRENTVEKDNKIQIATFEDALRFVCPKPENTESLASDILNYLENRDIYRVFLHVEGPSEDWKTDKYHCDSAYEKYSGGDLLSSDEKFSLYYGIIHQIFSKYPKRKIQLYLSFENVKNACEYIKIFEKNFPNLELSDVVNVGFDSIEQEKNIAEYFYSANCKNRAFPVFNCYDTLPEEELLISILRLSKAVSLECVTFICEGEESMNKLSHCLEILRTVSDE